jgi:uncharacterized protein
MGPTKFEWDETKAESNAAKHGVRFEVAIRAFSDPGAADYDVSNADQGEIRRKTVGMIGDRLFAVIYTIRDNVVRIVSARRANSKESRIYDSFHS